MVVDAYLEPDVDKSEEKFSWGKPELLLLRQYPLLCENNLDHIHVKYKMYIQEMQQKWR